MAPKKAGVFTTTNTPAFNVQRIHMEKLIRTRNWTTIVYPESAPPNWISILKAHLVPAFISPLHNNDYTDDGEPKKPHHHVIILFDSVKTKEQAKEIFDSIGGVGVIAIKSIRTYTRYLCHLDNPEKAQYNSDDVISCSGADYNSIIGLASDRYTAIAEMIDYCVTNSIDSYAQLLMYAKANRTDWFRVLCDSGTVTIVQFLKSLSWEESKRQHFLPKTIEKHNIDDK